MIQSKINDYLLAILVFALFFVILLYKMIGFSFTDEICATALFVLFFYAMIYSKDWKFNKIFLITLLVFLFYAVYSVIIGSNSPKAIFSDTVIQLKPYLAFFCAYQLKPCFGEPHKKLLRQVSLLIWIVFLLPLGLASVAYPRIFELTMEHNAYYGIAVTIVSICYLYGSEFKMRDKIIFLLLLSIGIFSSKSKFYGFFAMSVFMIFFFSGENRFRLNFRNVMIILCMIAVMAVVAWDKISLYFFQAIMGDADKDMIARAVLYYKMPEILQDYFPFGSGFASYATYSSAEYYSDLYSDYGINNVYGLSKSFPKFISDTYYPCLAQFGYVGIALFLMFWAHIIRKVVRAYKAGTDTQACIIVMLIVGFFAIEGTTGSTFIAQGGFVAMMIMGIIFYELKLSEMKSDETDAAQNN
ncbi:MAG: O-antigen ligase domain-containing protein [Tannerella sp.]|jgi:hypothetical protein|nr:O-antigen ligase domain-containing protein [Tannerella sp.]